jgi:hypothetical protein
MSVDCFSRVSNAVLRYPTEPRAVAVVSMWYNALLSSSISYCALVSVVAVNGANCYHQHHSAFEQFKRAFAVLLCTVAIADANDAVVI